MGTIGSGRHWELASRFIDDDERLQLAGAQAVRLSELSDTTIVRDGGSYGSGVVVKRFSIDQLHRLPLGEDFTELLGILAKARGAIGSSRNEAYLNIFQGLGTTGMHRDEIGEETFAIGLTGQARAEVDDPASDTHYSLCLYPGDALHFDNNQGPEAEQAMHEVKNVAQTPRVSLVINA
jgi:hypothetical protein